MFIITVILCLMLDRIKNHLEIIPKMWVSFSFVLYVLVLILVVTWLIYITVFLKIFYKTMINNVTDVG